MDNLANRSLDNDLLTYFVDLIWAHIDIEFIPPSLLFFWRRPAASMISNGKKNKMLLYQRCSYRWHLFWKVGIAAFIHRIIHVFLRLFFISILMYFISILFHCIFILLLFYFISLFLFLFNIVNLYLQFSYLTIVLFIVIPSVYPHI